jgi:pSer/pThr/pTyr-binding forkhead associated (FHA) protein
MGRLRELRTGRSCELEPEHVVGRSSRSSLTIEDARVSGHHAVVRWTGTEWTVRDLASRNGTLVDGVRILLAPQPIAKGARVCFGSPDVAWELIDASAPRPLLVSVEDGSSIWIDGEIIALPSLDNPVVTLFRDENGTWKLERPDGTRVLTDDGDTFEIDGHQWRFQAVASRPSTTDSVPDEAKPPKLLFWVTSDEEHVELAAEKDGRRLPLGTSPRYYMLLTLARQRAADRNQGLPETSCGWMYHDDLQRALALGQQHLNVDVFRIRRQLSDKGLVAAATVIERRPRSRQLRLGWRDFEIQRL